MNQITHWLDASNVYGSDNEEAELLRKHVGGKLKVTTHGTEDMLPQCNLYPDMYEELEICGEKGTKTPCQSHCMAAGMRKNYISLKRVFLNLLNKAYSFCNCHLFGLDLF